MNDYTNTDHIQDAETWLQQRSTTEIAEAVERLDFWELEWLKYVADGNAEAIIQSEIASRDNPYKGGTMQPQEEEKSTRQVIIDNEEEEDSDGEIWDSGLEVYTRFNELAEDLIGATTLEQYALEELGVEKNKILIPQDVRKVCKAIQEDVGTGKEFGVLFKGEWTDEGFKVKPDYVIPEQEVTAAHIDYTEDLKKYRDQGYIVNAHSHPHSGKNAGFSGVDDDHVNSHFDVAILYGGRAETIVGGVANIEAGNGRKVQIEPEVVVEEEREELPTVDTGNVEVKTRRTQMQGRHGHAPPSYHGYQGYLDEYGEEESERMKASSTFEYGRRW